MESRVGAIGLSTKAQGKQPVRLSQVGISGGASSSGVERPPANPSTAMVERPQAALAVRAEGPNFLKDFSVNNFEKFDQKESILPSIVYFSFISKHS